MVAAVIGLIIAAIGAVVLVAVANLIRPMGWTGVGRIGSAVIVVAGLITGAWLLSLTSLEVGYGSPEAIEAARRAGQAEAATEAACLADLDCLAARGAEHAETFCRVEVQVAARHGAKWDWGLWWTDYRWRSKSDHVVTYIARQGLRLQNGYGAWGQARAECDVHVPSGRVLAVRARMR